VVVGGGSGLLSSETLAWLEDDTPPALFVIYVLARHGFPEEDLPRIRTVLVKAGRAMRRDGDKVQRFLRRHGDFIRDELTGELASDAMSHEDVRYAVSQWLQNALSLPVSLEHQAVRVFFAHPTTSHRAIFSMPSTPWT
jgi:hypothetical protein